jgi:hypothetical protein
MMMISNGRFCGVLTSIQTNALFYGLPLKTSNHHIHLHHETTPHYEFVVSTNKAPIWTWQ